MMRHFVEILSLTFSQQGEKCIGVVVAILQSNSGKLLKAVKYFEENHEKSKINSRSFLNFDMVWIFTPENYFQRFFSMSFHIFCLHLGVAYFARCSWWSIHFHDHLPVRPIFYQCPYPLPHSLILPLSQCHLRPISVQKLFPPKKTGSIEQSVQNEQLSILVWQLG